MKGSDFDEIQASLRKEFGIFEMIKLVSWADSKAGDLLIIGNGWVGINIRTGTHMDVGVSYLKFVEKVFLNDRRYNSDDMIQQYKKLKGM